MTPVIGYYHRTSKSAIRKSVNKKRTTSRFPVCVYVRIKNSTKTYSYITGLNLSKKEYALSQNLYVEGNEVTHASQINAAYTRMKDIAELLNPFSRKVFAYILKKARKDYKHDIFIDPNFKFDAREIVSKFLRDYILTHQHCETTILEKISIRINPVILPRQLNPCIKEIHTDTPRSENFNSSNFLDHLMEKIDAKINPKTEDVYKCVKDTLINFFNQRGQLKYIPV